MLQIIPISRLPIITEGDNVAQLILTALTQQHLTLKESDILVIVQSIISKAEGRIVNLSTVTPRPEALHIAKTVEKPPELIELILQESNHVEKITPPHIIVETHHGFVCANAGIDASNSGGKNFVTLLPENPDHSAQKIQNEIYQRLNLRIGVIITDTHGRTFREGAINIAIGTAGIPPIIEHIGNKDLYGYELKSTRVALIDQIASAAGLIMGESNEGIPAVIVRGLKIPLQETSITSLIRLRKNDIFRDFTPYSIKNSNKHMQ